MSKTNIGWAQNPDGTRGEVWNPTVGCSHSGSRGCDFCYAERMAMRLKAMGVEGYEDVVDEKGWTGRVMRAFSRWDAPSRWRKPRRVFVNSMSDIFHEQIADRDLRELFSTMALARQHTFIILTKRYERAVAFMRNETWQQREMTVLLGASPYSVVPPNIWLIFSASTQAEVDECVPILLRSDAAVKGLSLEPMLEEVSLGLDARGLDWVVVGAESGPHRRPFDVRWAEDVYAQCKDAGIAYFGKQDSGVCPGVPLLIDGREVKEWPKGG